LGLNDKTVEGAFRWVDDRPLDWTMWDPSEPNGGAAIKCAALIADLTTFWYDTECYYERYALCQLKTGEVFYG